MGVDETKEVYAEIAKKFSMPDFMSIEKELEISNLDANKFLLRAIRNKIKSRLETYTDMIEDILHPDASVASMHELTYINDVFKQKAFKLYKKLMYMQRTGEYLDIEKSNRKDAKFIKQYFDHISYINQEMKKIIKARMNTWTKQISEEMREVYFG